MQCTESARTRYPEEAGYYRPADAPELLIACRCTDACPTPCVGQCGCKACLAAYEDWDGYGSLDS